jgi:hypothetical protein
VGSTRAENTVVIVSTGGPEPDHADTVTYADLAFTLHVETEPTDPSDYADVAPRGNDKFGV